MKVKERLQHGYNCFVVVPSVLICAALALMPNFAIGQIIEPADPYGNETVERPTLEQPSNSAPTTANTQADQTQLAFLRVRQFIAQGNTFEAERYLAMIPANHPGVLGDTRQSAANLINRQRQLAQMRAQEAADYDQQAVAFLLKQSQEILKYRDFATAEMLVGQAKLFQVDYSNMPINPDLAMQTIASAKQSQPAMSTPADQLMGLMAQAQLAFDKQQFQVARSLVLKAQQLGVPENQIPSNQMRPWQLDLKIQDALKTQGNVVPVSFEKAAGENVVQADYYPETDTTRNVTVAATQPVTSASVAAIPTTTPTLAMQQYQAGVQALQQNDRETAKQYFSAAWKNRQDLEEAAEKTVEEQLRNLVEPIQANGLEEIPASESLSTSNDFQNVQQPAVQPQNTNQQPVPMQPVPNQSNVQDMSRDLVTDAQQEQLFRRLQSEVFRQRATAEQLRTGSPREAIATLTELRSKITSASITDQGKRALLNFVDRDIAEIQKFVQANLADIQLAEENAATLQALNDDRQKRYNTELQIQKLIEDFDDLMDEQRYAEANMVAQQAAELDPNSEIVAVLKSKAAIQMNVIRDGMNKEAKEADFLNAMHRVDEASIQGVDEINPLKWRDVDEYARDAERRLAWLEDRQYSSPEEAAIWNILKKEKVQGHYQGTLADAIRQLSEQSGVNILFDSPALAASSISSDTAVDIPIQQPISLRSALNVILGTSGLVFVVEDEVVKVTSREAQRRDVKPKTYYVGDLVTPIQNFNNSLSMNFLSPQGQYGHNGFIGQSNQVPLAQNNTQAVSPLALASQSAVATDPSSAMAQQLGGLGGLGGGRQYLGGGGPVQSGTPTYGSIGPQSLGGVTEADFQPLINLIKNSIDPEGWDDTNGDGTIQAFVPNLSLIVSQTQEVQDEIQDLLNQLRDLNDVQIVVEVRFVTLDDSFFERIGIDFDFNLNDNSGLAAGGVIPDEVNPSSAVGILSSDAAPTFNPDLDLPFRQGSFVESVPLIGGFSPEGAARFGFAILSDIEVFFLLNAAKGDSRTNVTQAPTVTMFNGQVATVSDGAIVPFVTSVIPVVGDFAVAQQPVITLLPEGASLNVQATVSNDRKSVRLNLVPFFSQITEVQTFTFDGSTTTQRASDSSLIDDLLGAALGNGDGEEDPVEIETTTQGVTVQLPTLGFTSVSTVVSVPDGGTILIGGVKRQSEQRVERGVPFLSNIPYVSRLFKNVGIGRDTESLMMMVSPKIIIQEEEELDQVGTTRN